MASSSFLEIMVETKDESVYYAYWDSGNIDLDYLEPISFTQGDYLGFKTGADLLDSCYEYIKRVCQKWMKMVPEYIIPQFTGDVYKIGAIQDFSTNVLLAEIRNSLDIYEPVYEHVNHFNYITGRVVNTYLVPDDEGIDNELHKVSYYPGITFEDDIYLEETEMAVVQRCSELTSEELNYVIAQINSDENCLPVKENDNGKGIYESLARFLASIETSLMALYDAESYLMFIDNNVEELNKSEQNI